MIEQELANTAARQRKLKSMAETAIDNGKLFQAISHLEELVFQIDKHIKLEGMARKWGK